MKSFEQLAQAAYETYREEFMKKTGPLLEWQRHSWATLPSDWKDHWIAVAKKLHADISAIQ